MMQFSLEYHGFKGSACFDRKRDRHYGMVLDVTDGVVYESSSAEGLIANFEAAVDEYISFQKDLGNDDSSGVTSRPAISIVVSHAATAA